MMRPLWVLMYTMFMLVGAAAQPQPFFEQADELRRAYGAEMLLVRLAALEALASQEDARLEEIAEALEDDMRRIRGSLGEANPETLARLDRSIDAVRDSAGGSGEKPMLAAIAEARNLAGAARGLLSTASSDNASFSAALAALLVLHDDGVAEAYEDAVEGKVWELALAWASLERVAELWQDIAAAVQPGPLHREAEAALQQLTELVPSPIPPAVLAGDPEEAEEPAHRLAGILERVTDAELYPDRDLARLGVEVIETVQRGCAAFAAGEKTLGLELISGAELYYDRLEKPMRILGPELNERLTVQFNSVLEGDEASCGTLEAETADIRQIFGG